MKSDKNQTFRNQMKDHVWKLLDDFKGDPSFAKQCVTRDEIVTLICDSVSKWESKSVDTVDDWSTSKEKWIAR